MLIIYQDRPTNQEIEFPCTKSKEAKQHCKLLDGKKEKSNDFENSPTTNHLRRPQFLAKYTYIHDKQVE